ncbi:MAG TPA: tyrosine-type recombinase/integrase, partial [Verrucomicrobiae bacterium]|nr:tyrosine-type recombinase/integrase [Verrucomicrobiae bacterium]
MITQLPKINGYIEYLKTLTDMVMDSIERHEKFLHRVEVALGKPILSVERGSEINEVILKIAATRKIAYNGGKPDPTGADLKFRLGKSVCNYVTWAHTENYIPRNFYPKNPFPKPHMAEAYYLEEKKVWLLYKYEGFDLKTKAIIRFLIDTGVRVSELCKIKLKDVEFESGKVSVYMSKVRRDKEVPIMLTTKETILQMLKERKIESEYLFCCERKGDGMKVIGAPLSTGAVRRRLRKWAVKFGFRINPHSFRHGIATIWFKKFGLVPTMKLLGHIDPKYTAHYYHVLCEELSVMQKEISQNKLQELI